MEAFNFSKRYAFFESTDIFKKNPNSYSIIDLETSSLAQIINKADLNFISFKIINNSYIINVNNSNKLFNYLKSDVDFKFNILKVLLIFLNDIKWECKNISESLIDFLVESHRFSNFNWLKRIIKNPYKIIQNSNKELIVLNKKETKKELIIFRFLKIKNAFFDQYNYNYIYDTKIKRQSNFNNFNININFLWMYYFKYKKINNVSIQDKCADLLYNQINEDLLNIHSNKPNLVIKFELDLAFFAINKKNKEFFDDKNLCNVILITKIVNKLNIKFKEKNYIYGKVLVYLYIKNSEEFLIYSIVSRNKNGRIKFNGQDKLIDKNLVIL